MEERMNLINWLDSWKYLPIELIGVVAVLMVVVVVLWLDRNVWFERFYKLNQESTEFTKELTKDRDYYKMLVAQYLHEINEDAKEMTAIRNERDYYASCASEFWFALRDARRLSDKWKNKHNRLVHKLQLSGKSG
jgi:hypothetical protein